MAMSSVTLTIDIAIFFNKTAQHYIKRLRICCRRLVCFFEIDGVSYYMVTRK